MSWFSRLTNALNPSRLDDDLADEARDHIERRAADLQRKGLSPSEARRQATRTFGNVAGFREESREIRLWAGLEGALQDLRYAWRGMLRAPVFAVTAVISLSLAIAANTAIYAIVEAALLRPLPVPQTERLFTLAVDDDDTFSYPLYEQLRAAARGPVHLSLFGSPNRVEALVAQADATYEQVIQQVVSPGSFDMLGVSPALGRLFSETEDGHASALPAVVLSYDYWQRRFGASKAVLGQRLVVDGRPYSIAGVVREGYSGPAPGKFVDVWLPVAQMDPGIFNNSNIRLFHLMGRLAPGQSRQQISAVMQPVFRAHQKTRVGENNSMPAAIQQRWLDANLIANSGAAGISALRRTFARPLWILLGVAACILLIACANIASLLLARSTARSAEMAVRISLGARRARLVRQLLTESLLISTLAGVGGWALAGIAAPVLVTMVSSEVNPIRLDLAVNSRMLFFCAAICALSALFFGMLPAWQATASRPMLALRHPAGLTGRLRMGRFFAAVQVAFAFCLVTGGAGFLFSLRNLTTVDTGFDPHGVMVLTMTNTSSRDRQLALLHELQLRTAALPQVKSAATAWTAVLSGARRADRVALPGRGLSDHEETFYRVSPGYFATLRTPLLSGRDFTFRDNDDEPVPTIVNRAFARRYFENDEVLGKEFRRDDGVRHQIVGLSANSLYGDLRSGPEAIAYMPMKPPRIFTLYVRSTLDPGSVMKMVEGTALSLDAGLRVRDAATLESLIGRTILTEKLLAGIGGAFAILGLVLAALGIFGLLNYSVTLRTREIGIRTALGAQRLPIYILVLRDLTGVLGGGLAAGLAGSLALLGVTRSLLFGIRPADPMVIAVSTGVFASAALVACWLPARRAAAIDPLAALRIE